MTNIETPDYIYLLLLSVDSEEYLLCNGSNNTPSLMVWSSFEGLSQAVIKTGGVLKELNPMPVYIPAYLHPGVKDLYLNAFILEVTDKESIADIEFKQLGNLFLLKVEESFIEKYIMKPK